MAEGLVLADLVPLVALMAGAGLGAGLLAGFLGVGGGIILVPILYQAFTVLGVDEAVRMHLSVGTSLAVIIPTSIRSLHKHNAQGAVDVPVLKAWAVPVILGVVVGSVVANALSGDGLTLVFAVLGFSIAAYMALAPEDWHLAKTMPGPFLMRLFGGLIGFFSTLIGIGGGSFGVSLMTLYGQPIHRAVGTSSGLGLLISVPATLGFIWAGWGETGRAPFSIGFVNLAAWAIIIPMTVFAVPYGVRLAHKLNRRYLRRAFAGFLALNVTLLLVGQYL